MAVSEWVMEAVIVNWNGSRFLPGCLSKLAQSSTRVHPIVVDNASTDQSVELLRNEYREIELIQLGENLGYAGGANTGIRASSSDYVIVMNPDVILASDHLAILKARMDADPSLGATQGRLLQITAEDYLAGRTTEDSPLDSAGHRASRTRMVYDRGQGEKANGRYTSEEPVFSACGAALMLRRSMLDDIAIDGEYFDEAFFAYKEDIDLCWRARLRGWDVRYIPEAVGWHVRGWAGGKAPSPQALPFEARFHSFKNHYLLLLKNETLGNLLRDLPWIAGWELLRQGHALLQDRSMYRVYPELLRLLPDVLRKRRDILRRRRTPPNEIRRWFVETS